MSCTVAAVQVFEECHHAAVPEWGEELGLASVYGGMELRGNHTVLVESPKMTDSDQSWDVNVSLLSPRHASNTLPFDVIFFFAAAATSQKCS